jgi:hypothetical protein
MVESRMTAPPHFETFEFQIANVHTRREPSMPWPLAIVAMAAMLAGGYCYVKLVARLFKRINTTLHERGCKPSSFQCAPVKSARCYRCKFETLKE